MLPCWESCSDRRSLRRPNDTPLDRPCCTRRHSERGTTLGASETPLTCEHGGRRGRRGFHWSTPTTGLRQALQRDLVMVNSFDPFIQKSDGLLEHQIFTPLVSLKTGLPLLFRPATWPEVLAKHFLFRLHSLQDLGENLFHTFTNQMEGASALSTTRFKRIH